MASIFKNKDYCSCLHPNEKIYFHISLFISVVAWITLALATFGLGLLSVAFAALWGIIAHAIFLSGVRWYSIKVSENQYKEIYAIAKKITEKLELTYVPDIYISNMDGIFNAFATRLFSRNFIILTTTILDACDDDLGKLEFIIAHEMVHIQRRHVHRQFLLAPSRLLPWLSEAYSRACEYSCDGVAGKFIIGDRQIALTSVLLLPTAGKKRADSISLEAYEEQRQEGGDFFMTLVETNSSHPFSFQRVAYLRKLFGDDIARSPRSFLGALLAPIFSFRALIIIYIVVFLWMGVREFMTTIKNSTTKVPTQTSRLQLTPTQDDSSLSSSDSSGRYSSNPWDN